MARLLGPDPSCRLVYRTGGATLQTAVGAAAVVYADDTATTPADIATYDGTSTPGVVIEGSTITVDVTSQLALFWFPDGVHRLWVRVAGGPVTEIVADLDSWVGTGGGGSGTVTSVAGVDPDDSGNVALTAGDVDADPAGAAAAVTLTSLGGVPAGRQITAGTGLTGGGDLSADRALAVVYGTSAGTAAQGNDPRFSSTKAPVTLTDAATITTDASAADTFRVVLGGNRTLAVPSNGTDTQTVTWEITQDGTGGRTLTLAAGFRFGTSLTSVTLSTTAGATDVLAAKFHSPSSTWRVVAFLRGF